MKIRAAYFLAGLLALLTLDRAQADGTEGLGTPSIPIATGTGIAAGGVGLITQPGTLNVTVPIGATVKQVLLYWEGFMATDTAGDSTIRVSKGGPSTIVNGTLIGGPSFFFFTAYASTFRADITSLGLITPGANSLTLDGLNFTFADGNPLQFANHGAGIFVIYDDGGPATQINVRDGNDLAYWNFPDPRRDTIPQTFTFAPAPANRVSRLDMFFASVAGKTSTGTIERPNAIEITVGGVTTVYNNLMDSFSGEEWDHVSLPVTIPAGVTTVKVQAFSRDGVPLGLNPASFDWLAAFFAIQTTAHIGDLVFNDLNANGVQDGGGEVGVAGVTVELFTCPGNVLVGTTVTAGGGLYGFDVPPGDYYVKFRNLPAGFIFSPSTPGAASDPTDSDANPATGITDCTTIISGENDPTWDAGIYQPIGTAQIGDLVFNDTNANGNKDGGEVGVDGVTVELFTCVGNVLTGTTVTAGGGLYLFTVPPGNYYVKFSNLPPGFVFSPSTPSAASDPTDSDANPGTGATDCTTLTGGEVDLTWDAGIYQPALIGDLVFNDTNANGIQDFLEPGVNGVKVELFTCVGNVLMGTTDTAGGGLYAFTVPPGDYYVKFSNLPAGFVFSPSTPSNVSDATDSDANPATGVADCTTLVAGEVDLTWDAGIYQPAQPARIGDLVFNDANANGNQDVGELGVNGVTVELFTCGGNVLTGTTVTAGGGLYLFTVLPGNYYVKFSNLPAGFVFSPSTPSAASDSTDSDANPATGATDCTTLVAGETDLTWDAGIYQPPKIGDLVFNDTNANGNQDVGELGVNGVKVELFTCIGNVLMGTTVTAGGGVYGFTVPPGNYYVKFSNLPAGFVFSPSTPSAASDSTDSDANPATGTTDCTTLVAGETDLTWDAGIYQPPKIGDLVFNDTNANGNQDVGELGVNGVTVELFTCIGNVLMGTTVTAGGGVYGFTVPPGNYYVKFSNLPAGFVFSPSTPSAASDSTDSDANPATGLTDCTTLLPGETDLSWDAGIYQPPQVARIGDLVFRDLNANGMQDGGELGIDGVTVQLFTCAGNVPMGTKVTAGGGLYSFDVPPGDYYVRFSNLPAGFVFSPSSASGASDPNDSDANPGTGTANCTTLVANETDLTWDAGIYPLACIGNMVFNDLNANGTQDSGGEVGVDGVTVQLFKCLNDDFVAATITSSGGLYSFCVPPGNYYVSFSNLPVGFVFSPSVPGGGASDATDSDANPATGKTECTTLDPGETDPTWDAGIYQPACIGNLVFNDLNANGNQDGGAEIGVNGVTVELFKCAGDTLVGTTVTAGGGVYSFCVPPGSYYVKFSNLPAGFVSSPSTSSGASDATDSDANPATGKADCTTLDPGETDTTWDAGIYQPACIGNLVFNDLNANGTQDGGEVGVNDVTVELYKCAGNILVDTKVTSGGGLYSFCVPPGDYYVRFHTLPAGFVLSPSTPSGDSDPNDSDANPGTGRTDCTTLTAGENDPTWDAGIYQPAQIGDRVFNDTDNDGNQDVGELGVNGVTVQLFTCGDAPMGSTVTANGGLYSFTVRPGSYYVKFSNLPAGFNFSPSTPGGASDPTDSDADPATGKTDCTDLTPGETDTTWDAGIHQPVNPVPCLTLTKTASKTTVAPYEPVTYTYTACNCGSTPLSNVVITDDNGTPTIPIDDFVVGTIPTLAAGTCQPLTAQVIPVISTVMPFNNVNVPAGSLIIVTTLPNGDIKATYLQDFGVNDNTYGTGAIGWPGGHTFGNLTGSDKLEFRFFAKNGTVPLDVYIDTVSAATSVTVPGTGQVITYPSGYGTFGPFGGDGSIVAGNANNIVTFSTAISDNLNKPANLPNKAALIVNSPTSLVSGNVVVDPVKAPGGWDHINSFTVVVKGSTFAAGGGFDKVTVPDQHNSPSKGPKGTITITNSMVTNTATATAGSLTATAKAVVSIDTGTGGPGPGGPLPAPWQTSDIGAVGAAGSASFAANTFTVTGSGKEISSSKDEFRYVYQPANGDCTIVAKVLTIGNTHDESAAGVMIRETLNDNSKHASMLVTAAKGLQFKSRTTTGGSTSKTTVSGSAPYWVRVVRTGNTFTASRSTDGVIWTSVGSVNITMGASVYIGMPVTSKRDGDLTTATLNNVTATP